MRSVTQKDEVVRQRKEARKVGISQIMRGLFLTPANVPISMRLAVCAIAWALLHRPSLAAEPIDAVGWKTDAELQRQLDSRIGIRWSQNPLRDALENLARVQQVAIFLDRRVDPGQPLEFSVSDTPLREVIERLAAGLDLGLSFVGPVAYFGPRSSTEKLATLAAIKDQQAKAAPVAADRLLRKRRLQWERLSTPREVIDRIATDYGMRVEGMEQVAHDLWPAAELPPMTFGQAMTVVLGGFDLTFEFAPGGRTIQLVPMPRSVSIQRIYEPRGDRAQILAALRQQYPGLELEVQNGQVTVDAPVEVHEAIARIFRGQTTKPAPSRKSPKGETRYTLKIENQPVGGIAQALAKRLGREVRFHPDLTRQRLEMLVSFQVEDVTLEELFKALLSPAKMDYQLDDKTLTIVPAP